jgi:hypothetical protein
MATYLTTRIGLDYVGSVTRNATPQALQTQMTIRSSLFRQLVLADRQAGHVNVSGHRKGVARLGLERRGRLDLANEVSS